jgi:XRE family transcriptional regulator, master regulator for biofilm formation
MDNSPKSLAEKITSMRKDRGWTITELSRRTSIIRQHLQKIESGSVTNPRIDTLRTIAEAFGVGVDKLLT